MTLTLQPGSWIFSSRLLIWDENSFLFSRSVVSDSLRPHGLQHARPPCLSPAPRVYSNLCPSVMPSNHFILCHLLLLLPSVFPSIMVFSSESVLHIMWPKYWNFSFKISPSNEYSGLISFRMDWFDLPVVQGTLKESSPAPQFETFNSSLLSSLYSPTLTSVHHYWEPYLCLYGPLLEKWCLCC